MIKIIIIIIIFKGCGFKIKVTDNITNIVYGNKCILVSVDNN